MQVLGVRFCSVSEDAPAQAAFFDALGLPRQALDAEVSGPGFNGAVFPAGSGWIEIWPQGPMMPAGMMVQLVVDDADAFADHARAQGLAPEGPVEAHGERIYFAQAPGGLKLSFQSALPATAAA